MTINKKLFNGCKVTAKKITGKIFFCFSSKITSIYFCFAKNISDSKPISLKSCNLPP